MNSLNAAVGSNIRCLRRERKLSQESLAHDAQITTSHLGCIERGTGNPTLETLISIANALQIDLLDIIIMQEGTVGASSKYQLSFLQEDFSRLSEKRQQDIMTILRTMISWNDNN